METWYRIALVTEDCNVYSGKRSFTSKTVMSKDMLIFDMKSFMSKLDRELPDTYAILDVDILCVLIITASDGKAWQAKGYINPKTLKNDLNALNDNICHSAIDHILDIVAIH